MQLIIDHITQHRNGISGAPFHAVLFRDPDEGVMLGVVFEAEHHVAVFNLDKLALGNIAFGVNSWRGDRYEPHLRRLIKDHRPQGSESCPIRPAVSSRAVHELLAARHEIVIVWGTEDVRSVRPDLTDEQAWAVLKAVERGHDANIGICWDVLQASADSLFPLRSANEGEDAHG